MENEQSLYRVTSLSFVAGVIIEKEPIVKTAPILRVFKGQNINNLIKWANNKNFKIEKIK